MPSLLESINIFHNEQFWRFKGERSISHRCGGVLTLIIMIIFGVITGFQIYLINQRDTITVDTQSQIDFSPELMNITTSQNDPDQQPFMVAMIVSELSNGATFSPADYKLSAYKSTQYFDLKTSSYLYNYTEIQMENCTPYHFSKLPNIFQKFKSWGMGKWFCFPINQTFEVGGNILEVKKYMEISLECNSQNCNQNNSSSLIVNLMTLNTYVNPTNNTEPYMAYFNRREAVFQSTISSRNFIYIDKTILATDINLIPFSNYKLRSSFQEGSYTNSDSYISNNPSSTFFIIFSGKTITHKRHYLKLLTALSFVGGLIAPIIGVFSLIFMMGKFGTLVYELRFANDFFQKKKKGFKFHYFSFLEQVFRNIWGSCTKSQQEETFRQREKLKKTVNNLMDVVYLQKRIAFLQKCMTVVFEKHQLKALHMQYSLTQEEACINFQNYKVRPKFKRFLLQSKGMLKTKSTEDKDHSGAINPLKQEIITADEQKIAILRPPKPSKFLNLQKIESGFEENLRKTNKPKPNRLSILTNFELKIPNSESKISTEKDLIDSEELNGGLDEIDISQDQQVYESASVDDMKGVQTLEEFAKLLNQVKQKDKKSCRIFEMMDKRMQKVIVRANDYLNIAKK